MSADIVVVGDVMTDIIVRPHGPLVPGSDRASTICIAPGGSGANQAAWLGHLGARVALVARVGATECGRIGQALCNHGVQPHLAADCDLPTGRLVTLLDATGERSFLTDRGANDALCAADLSDDLLTSARLLHISGYSLVAPGPRAAVLGYAARAGQLGMQWSVDAGSAGFIAQLGPAAFRDWTDPAAVLFANADEAAVLTGASDPDAQLAALGAARRLVVLKRGAAGAIAAGPGAARCAEPAPRVAVADTTGAGDAFLAAFLLRWLEGDALPACLAAGVARGAEAAGRFGGRPPRSCDQTGVNGGNEPIV